MLDFMIASSKALKKISHDVGMRKYAHSFILEFSRNVYRLPQSLLIPVNNARASSCKYTSVNEEKKSENKESISP